MRIERHPIRNNADAREDGKPTVTSGAVPPPRVHPLVKIDYLARVIGAASAALIVVSSRLSAGEAMPVGLWIAVVLYALAWPHVAYLFARRNPSRSRNRERRSLLVDTAVAGAAIPLVAFQPVPTLGLLLPYGYFLASQGGPGLLAAGVSTLFGGALLSGWLLTGFAVITHPPLLETAFAATLLLVFQLVLGLQTYSTARGLVKSRKRVAEQSAEIQRQNDELVLAREEALQAARAKAAFLATMSHEIRTPLNGVLGMSRLLEETPHTAEQGEFLDTIKVSGNTLLAVVNDILDYSRIESGRLELEQEPIRLIEVAEEALEIVSERARKNDLELIADFAPDVPRVIVGDATRLRQVLTNLVNNAVKFTERGEVVVSARLVRPETEEQPGEIAIEVKDTGIGIPADRIPELFSPFSQADVSTTRKYGGTGLGLAICKRLIELMGGAVSVQSVVGQGSTFRFTILARHAAMPSEVAPETAPVVAGRRVLVVDDNETNRRVLRGQLARWKLDSEGADGAAQALAALADERRFDLAILDLHMPDEDGMTLARRIRESPHGRRMPLILLSSSFVQAKDDPDRLFVARLIKPARESRLFDAIMRALGAVVGADRAIPPGPANQRLADSVPLSILVADDNEINRSVAGLIFRRFGYDAEFAVNGRDAVDQVVHHSLASDHHVPFDVVFMDVHMPEMDGLDASRAIRRLESEQPDRRWPRIVAMTADAMSDDRQLCLDAGMDDYITKPLDFDAVQTVLAATPPSPELAARPAVTANPPAPAANDAATPDAAAADAPPGAAMDWSRLEELRGFDTPDGAVVKGAVAAFVSQTPDALAEVRSSATGRDGQRLRGSAHGLKGAAANIGAVAVAACAKRLEEAGKLGRFEDVELLLENLSTALVRTLVELHQCAATPRPTT
jgi:signal transduction histidine kinase/DNA-binding response OmpR family regulator/HPt (histidine-containing phosphotransfer) domain-containing protein